MTKYKCGHEINEIILDSNIFGMSAYFDWKDTVGFEGDESLCWVCYCKLKGKEEKKNG